MTLVELMAVLAILGTLTALAVPPLEAMVSRARVRIALNHFTLDLWYARMLAVRSGARVEVRLGGGAGCVPRRPGRITATAYTITVLDSSRRVVRETRLDELAPGVCLESNNDATIVYGSRGLPVPFENRTVWARKGSAGDSAALSVLGRVRRM